jgi:hypothetical protein
MALLRVKQLNELLAGRDGCKMLENSFILREADFLQTRRRIVRESLPLSRFSPVPFHIASFRFS